MFADGEVDNPVQEAYCQMGILSNHCRFPLDPVPPTNRGRWSATSIPRNCRSTRADLACITAIEADCDADRCEIPLLPSIVQCFMHLAGL